MKTAPFLLAHLATLVLALVPAWAGAAMYTWNTTTGSSTPSYGARTFTSTSGNQTLSVRAYSTPIYDTTAPFDVSGNWVEAKIAVYGGGIGVTNMVAGDATSETSSPEHAVDNNGVKDLVVFELPAGGWDVESFMLGWASTDSDVQAWVGGSALSANYDFRNACFSGTGCATLGSLGFTEITGDMPAVTGGTASPGGASGADGINVPTGVAAPFNSTATGKYLIMSGNLGLNGVTGDNDYFKISQLSARVPLPASLPLLALGLALLFASRRPFRARTTA